MKNSILITLYLTALVAANLIVKHFGASGLWFASAFLIPFDYFTRCILHETLKGFKLVMVLILLTLVSSFITVVINYEAMEIALASVAGITSVQIVAGLIYQAFKQRSYLFKVNVSDAVAATVDSLVFQFIAFGVFDWTITVGQIAIKIIGGLFWYFVIFKLLKFKPNEQR